MSPPRLPLEIYERIARSATEQHLPTTLFTIPNTRCLSNFAQASPTLKAIVRKLDNEIRSEMLGRFRTDVRNDKEALQVRYFRLFGDDMTEEDWDEGLRRSFYSTLGKYSKLTSLVLSTLGQSSPETLLELQSLPLADTLQCLEMPGDFDSWYDLSDGETEMSPVSFPNLVALRFLHACFVGQRFRDFVGKLSNIFEWLQESGIAVVACCSRRWGCLEGLERGTSTQDHEGVRNKECELASILGEKLPSLKTVRLVNMFCSRPKEEQEKHVIRRSEGTNGPVWRRDPVHLPNMRFSNGQYSTAAFATLRKYS